MQISEKRVKQATALRQAGLVSAALQLAAQRSPADITTGDLAQAVGITQGAVFRHFASKEALWLAVLDWSTEALMTRLHTAAAQASALAGLGNVFTQHVEFVVAHPGVPRIIFQELQHATDSLLKARVRELMRQYRQLLTGLLQRAQAQHEIDPDTDLQAAAVLFIGSVQGLVMQSLISGQVCAMPAQAVGVLALYLRGLGVKPTESNS